MVGGEVLMRDHRLTKLDEREIVAQAKLSNHDLMERVNGLSF